jgi:hypothetical protein
MSQSDYSYVSFSDEPNWNVGRYRVIGMLSGERGMAPDLDVSCCFEQDGHGTTRAYMKWV